MGKDDRRKRRRRRRSNNNINNKPERHSLLDDEDDEDEEEKSQSQSHSLSVEDLELEDDEEEDDDAENLVVLDDDDDENQDSDPDEIVQKKNSRLNISNRGRRRKRAENDSHDEEDSEDDDESERIRKHKLKLVLKLPKNYPAAAANSASSSEKKNNAVNKISNNNNNNNKSSNGAAGVVTSRRRGRPRKSEQIARKNAELLAQEEEEEDEEGEKPLKKRKLNVVAVGNGGSSSGSRQFNSRSGDNKVDKQTRDPEGPGNAPVDKTPGRSGEAPMPDDRLLDCILDKLQKKDTYSVFAQPVDPKELPDYHEIIKNPMDFATVRKKLAKGAYSSLEQFEKDVFLICTNAMHYNASDTIYYKQARAIQELAKKKFQTLRTDPDAIEAECKLTSKTRSGFPKRSSRKSSSGRYLFEPASSDFSGATGGENFNVEKPGNGSAFSDLVADNKVDKYEDFSATMYKSTPWRNGKRQQVIDENRRATYKPYNQLESGNDAIFSILDGESKLLIPVAVRAERAYAKSLARFTADLGPIAWRIAEQKIRRALPSGVSFGPGWVGEQMAPHNHPPNVAKPAASPGTLNALGENKPKVGDCVAEDQLSIDESTSKSIGTQSRPFTPGVANSTTGQLVANLPQPQTSHCQPVTNFQSDSKVTVDRRIGVPPEELKQNMTKGNLPITSNELSLMGAKFGSDVTQSRLLEMVSRNNNLMQHPSLQLNNNSMAINSNLPVNSEGNVGCAEDPSASIKGNDALKVASSPAGANVGTTNVATPTHNYLLGSGAFHPHQVGNKQANSLHELNGLANFMSGKMQVSHSRSANLPGSSEFVSNVSSSQRQDNPTAQAWAQTQNSNNTDMASRARFQGTSQPHMLEQKEAQLRDFSGIHGITPNMSKGSSQQVMSQFSGFHPQNSPNAFIKTSVPNTTTTESTGHNAVAAHAPMASHNNLWRSVPTQFIAEKSLSTSKPPDLNVEFQKAKSPPQQPSSSSLTDSQQPDLALQL